jgi:protoporphyrinogen oxidase
MKKQTGQSVGVIGSGLGGVAAACTLAARGYKVILFEKNPWLGGKAALLEGNSFRFDQLAFVSVRRETDGFVTVLKGRTGVNGIHDAGRFLAAKLRGQAFTKAHGEL